MTPLRTRLAALVGTLVVVSVIVTGCGREQPASAQVGSTSFAPADRQMPPAITGTTMTGDGIALRDLKGKVVVLNSWASWCAPCRDEIPGFVALAASSDPDQVEVLGLNVNDNARAAVAFAQSMGMTYPSLVDPDGHILATLPDVPPRAIPSTIILDKQGRVASRIIGRADPNELANTVAALVAEPASEPPADSGY